MDYGTNEFSLLDDQPTAFARWVLPALIVSLLLHVLLFIWVGRLSFLVEAFTAPKEEPATTFKLQRVIIDPKILESQHAEQKQVAKVPHAVKLPTEKPSFDQMMSPMQGAPAAPKIDSAMLAEKPKVDSTNYAQTLQDIEEGGIRSVSKELDQVRPNLALEKPGAVGKPLLDLAKPDVDSGGSPSTTGPLAGANTPGFSNLDDLLAATGPLTKETAPIRMDSDVLYAYNRYDLQPQAIESLRKLGIIIQRNPQLNFSIEGHSDSFGSDDYNLELSERRAESVKIWLIQNMNIDSARLSTKGYGKTRLIAPATGNVEEQQINRRVEIVLHDRNPTP